MLYKYITITELSSVESLGYFDKNTHWYYTEEDAKRYFRRKKENSFVLLSVNQNDLSPAYIFTFSNKGFKNCKGIEYGITLPINLVNIIKIVT